MFVPNVPFHCAINFETFLFLNQTTKLTHSILQPKFVTMIFKTAVILFAKLNADLVL